MGPAQYNTGNPLLDFFFTLFNGISEVPLFSSPITGILILAGVFLASRKAGAMMALSSLIGAGTAILFGAPYAKVAFGLYGFNSVLTGMAFWSGPFVKTNKATFFISVFGAAATAITYAALSHFMGDVFVIDGKTHSWAIPAFTSAFVVTTWILMYATKMFGHGIWPAPDPESLEHQTNPKQELIEGSSNPKQEHFNWTAKEFMIATLKGVAQVTFVNNWKTGIFWVVGLTLAFQIPPAIPGQTIPWWTNAYTAQWNPFSFLYLGGAMALLGSGIGTAMGILTKLPSDEIRNGLHGFNQVLVIIALTSFLPLTLESFLLAIFAVVLCSFVNPGLQRLFKTWGLPALTGPFVLTAWIFMLGVGGDLQHVPAGVGWSRPPSPPS